MEVVIIRIIKKRCLTGNSLIPQGFAGFDKFKMCVCMLS
ncbi:hypothetical protein SpAn4DRAFT_4383 [Sporomusa ovata]|uniref:Uncharacterized protein n=1 Tax=Sporomusa ovata TaxID=2378 RepID=A0A0U1L6W4_9FIRM|nr:hypothetical protein SpAn4DRAFT_4383 [Sporomusa ovata]